MDQAGTVTGEDTKRKMPGRESMNSYGAQVGKMRQRPVTIIVRNGKGWCSISTKMSQYVPGGAQPMWKSIQASLVSVVNDTGDFFIHGVPVMVGHEFPGA